MGKKLLIELMKLRDYEKVPVEGVFKQQGYEHSFKTIRELATFQFTCRKCEKAPCVHACPVEALKKDEQGVISRAMYKCIRCKSCIVICPFGTLVDDLFAAKTSGRKFVNLTGEKDMLEFAKHFPEDVVRVVEMEENPEQHIYELTHQILIREQPWK
ncbi:MAG: 4Fe-4S dicluster domain-containing protein [Bacteroidales bacterium]|nr:4Fe-4S dicluster domain-containing protein [Bacteroidales bacterium]